MLLHGSVFMHLNRYSNSSSSLSIQLLAYRKQKTFKPTDNSVNSENFGNEQTANATAVGDCRSTCGSDDCTERGLLLTDAGGWQQKEI